MTDRIIERSNDSRSAYLDQVKRSKLNQPRRTGLSCTNFAHAIAAASSADKLILHEERSPNIAIVSAYNDMLSAHQPFDRFPEIIREAARSKGASAQFAGGVPAMCDGVTQGRAGMELSLFSRDVIAQATAIALSHDVFDAVIYLGTCDKIVPGLVMGARVMAICQLYSRRPDQCSLALPIPKKPLPGKNLHRVKSPDAS